MGSDIVLVHNHPAGTRPSYADIKSLAVNDNVSGSVVVGNNGTVQEISLSRRNLEVAKIFDTWYNVFKQRGYPSREAILKATDKVYESGALEYVER